MYDCKSWPIFHLPVHSLTSPSPHSPSLSTLDIERRQTGEYPLVERNLRSLVQIPRPPQILFLPTISSYFGTVSSLSQSFNIIYICVCVCMYMCVCIYICVCVCVYLYHSSHIYIYSNTTCIYQILCIEEENSVSFLKHTYKYVCYMYIYIYAYMHAHTHMHTYNICM